MFPLTKSSHFGYRFSEPQPNLRAGRLLRSLSFLTPPSALSSCRSSSASEGGTSCWDSVDGGNWNFRWYGGWLRNPIRTTLKDG